MKDAKENALRKQGANHFNFKADNTYEAHKRQQVSVQGKRREKLDRQSLPSPLQYLTSLGMITRKPRAEWATIKCPVHKAGAEANPSMGVSMIDGHFKCMACGSKGGDIVALHRLITGMGFMDAVRDLGGKFE